MRLLEAQRRERSPSAQSVRSEISITSQGQTPKKFPATTALPEEDTGGEGGEGGEGPTIGLNFPLEWGLLIGILGVAVVLSAY